MICKCDRYQQSTMDCRQLAGQQSARHKAVNGQCVLFLVVAMLLFSPAYGQSKKQLERDKARIEKEIAQLNSELSKARKNTKNSTKQITLIKQRLNERTKLINNINSQMVILDRQIVRTEDSLRVVQGQIDRMKEEYAKVVRSLYGLSYNINPVGLLFDNETYNYSYLRLKYFTEYSRFRRHQATIIRRRQQQFENMTLDLQRQKNEKSSLLAQERKQKDALAKEQKKYQKNLDNSQQQEKNLQQQISKKEQQKRRLQQQIQQLINEEVAKGATTKPTTGKSSGKTSGSTASNDALSADFVSNKGRMPWPVYYKSVSREFGIYTHASGGQNRNYGIDLVCSPGAKVNAVCSGTVSRTFDTPNGTKGVLLRHGSYMTVYAGLGTVSVKQGDKVSAHQQIGTVATSSEGDSDFSFQVWCGKDALNPRHWLK